MINKSQRRVNKGVKRKRTRYESTIREMFFDKIPLEWHYVVVNLVRNFTLDTYCYMVIV